MSFFADVLVTVLTAYLAFTNALAVIVAEWLPAENPPEKAEPSKEVVADTKGAEPVLPALTSRYERGGAIPDILIKNAAYQQAAVGGALEGSRAAAPHSASTSDPLAALVNIFCTYEVGDYRYTRTGSGFFIDERGVIMTNAHVGQFLLLDDLPGGGQSDCVIRVGSPAETRYRAELLYISPAWILEHAALIDAAAPSGTGERDYALLIVTAGTEDPLLPARFPALPLSTTDVPQSFTDSTITIYAYPAESQLAEAGSAAELKATTATTTVSELFTFGSNRADVLSLRGSVAGERGSSGGPIVDASGTVIGMITTKGDDAQDGAGSLRAITLAHINRTIEEETSFSLLESLTGDLAYRATMFNTALVPFLSDTLVGELTENDS